jgi:hypothetical protein
MNVSNGRGGIISATSESINRYACHYRIPRQAAERRNFLCRKIAACFGANREPRPDDACNVSKAAIETDYCANCRRMKMLDEAPPPSAILSLPWNLDRLIKLRKRLQKKWRRAR